MKTFTLILILLYGCVTSAFAEVRNALVIGNGSYQQIGRLDNPVNDAALMGDTLRGLGFEVIQLIDAGQLDIKRAVRNFGARLNEAGREGIGLFYYAGHGVQVNGANYIIPVDAIIEREGDVDIEAINTNSILSMMEFSNARLNFVILDACRNNPYASGFRSGSRGLAKMNAPTGSLVAYATSPGDVAVDGSGKNSPYTAALVEAMNNPGVPIEKMFRNVRNDVRDKTSNRQTPWESSSLVGDDFYFNTTIEVKTTPEGQVVTVKSTKETGEAGSPVNNDASGATTMTPVVINNDNSTQLLFWDTIKDSTRPEMFQAYINKYPDGIFVELARLKIAAFPSSASNLNSGQTPSSVVASPTQTKSSAASGASTVVNPMNSLLRQCDAHINAKRLTTGAGGNALDCYTRVLETDSDNPEALQGLMKIEQIYARWVNRDIDQNNIQMAEKNIRKLRLVNANNPELGTLDSRLAALIISQQQVPQQSIVKTETAPVQVATTQPAIRAVRSDLTEECERYANSGRYVGRNSSNALTCYRNILNADSENKQAKAGLVNLEVLVLAEFNHHIKEDDLKSAETSMKNMKKVNRRSLHLGKMRADWEELRMENRW